MDRPTLCTDSDVDPIGRVDEVEIVEVTAVTEIDLRAGPKRIARSGRSIFVIVPSRRSIGDRLSTPGTERTRLTHCLRLEADDVKRRALDVGPTICSRM